MLATGMPHVDAASDFRRARRGSTVARWLRRACCLRTLSDAVPVRSARLKVIPLDAIVGTVEPSPHFDARFRPASEVVRARWERVALAHRRGVGLPPIAVVRRDDGYYVVDGRHRVSVARAGLRRHRGVGRVGSPPTKGGIEYEVRFA